MAQLAIFMTVFFFFLISRGTEKPQHRSGGMGHITPLMSTTGINRGLLETALF